MKKTLKIVVLVMAITIIIGIACVANALIGNPISKALVRSTAQKHLALTYPNTDYYIEDIGYNFKDTNYYVHVISPSSADCYFSLYIAQNGQLIHDNYEDQVLGKQNTVRRLYQEYRLMVDAVLEDATFPFVSDIGFGDLLFGDDVDAFGNPTFTIDQAGLELDKEYDVAQLATSAGRLILYVQDETVSLERAAQVMLEVKNLMDAQDVPFYAIDFVLQYPKTEADTAQGESVYALNFLYTDIYEDGMVARVGEANEKAVAYFAALDAEKYIL